MPFVAAIHWEKGASKLSYLMADLSPRWSIPVGPVQVVVPSVPHVAPTVQAVFQAFAGVSQVFDLEYKVLQDGTPVGRTYLPIAASPLSIEVRDELDREAARIPGCRVQNQLKSKLSGTSLATFKSGIQALTLGSRAWEIHLFSVLLHATNATVKDRLKVLWCAHRGLTSLTTQAARTSFQQWFAQL